MLKYFTLLLFFSILASASPTNVSYTASGSAGAWQLDFTVTNNMNSVGYPNQNLYFFGVFLGFSDVLTSPAGWVQEPWNPLLQGGAGPNINYDNTWITSVGLVGSIPAGGSSSSFVAGYSGATLPTTINWFAYTASNGIGGIEIYTNGDDFNGTTWNPGFAGALTSGSAVPEPGTAVLVVGGAGLLVIVRRRRRSGALTP